MANRTLVVFPCSASKRASASPRFHPSHYQSILDFLPRTRDLLATARGAIGGPAIDRSSPIRAALDYYDGHLYQTAGLRKAIADGMLGNRAEFLILSGAYGLLLPNEPIHHYDKSLYKPEWVRKGMLAILAEYIGRRHPDLLVTFAGKSTHYAGIMRAIPWGGIDLPHDFQAWLGSPLIGPSEAPRMRVPRALGEAILAFIGSGYSLNALRGARFSDSPIELEQLH
jgi:hypothetical protein